MEEAERAAGASVSAVEDLGDKKRKKVRTTVAASKDDDKDDDNSDYRQGVPFLRARFEDYEGEVEDKVDKEETNMRVLEWKSDWRPSYTVDKELKGPGFENICAKWDNRIVAAIGEEKYKDLILHADFGLLEGVCFLVPILSLSSKL